MRVSVCLEKRLQRTLSCLSFLFRRADCIPRTQLNHYIDTVITAAMHAIDAVHASTIPKVDSPLEYNYYRCPRHPESLDFNSIATSIVYAYDVRNSSHPRLLQRLMLFTCRSKVVLRRLRYWLLNCRCGCLGRRISMISLERVR